MLIISDVICVHCQKLHNLFVGTLQTGRITSLRQAFLTCFLANAKVCSLYLYERTIDKNKAFMIALFSIHNEPTKHVYYSQPLLNYLAFQYFDNDEGYSRNESCALNLMSTFLLAG